MMHRSFLVVRLIPWIILILIVSNSLFPVHAAAQSEEEILFYSQDFEAGYPDGWWLDTGWDLVETDEGHVLQGQGHTFATADVGTWNDFRLLFRVKFENGAALHANVRQVHTNRYFIGINPDHVYLSKQTGPEDFLDGLAGGYGLGSGWHQVEIAVYGNTLSLLVDGQQRFQYTDPDPLPGGNFSFESLGDALVWIDDVEVWGPRPEPTPTAPSEYIWTRLGGPIGGLGYDIRMHPHNPDLMYVTDAMAGVFISENSGQEWYASNEGVNVRSGATGDVIPVFCLTVDPGNPEILWIGTQFQRGIFKSIDGGRTWERKEQGIVERELTLRGFGVDPRDSNIVYAAAEVSSWEYLGEPSQGREFDMVGGVVYKTTDGGENWTPVWRGDNLARYVLVDPRTPDIVYVSTGIFDREAANSDPQTGEPGGVGVLKSSDAGKTWQVLNESNGLNNLYVGSLVMHPDNPAVLMAGTGNVQYNEWSGVYLTEDGGENWSHTLKNEMISSVEFAESDPSIAYAGGYSAMYRSEDGGKQWKRLPTIMENHGWGTDGTQAGHPIDFQVDPRDPDRIFVNNYGGGNFLSMDGGLTWEIASNGYTGAQVRDVAVNPHEPGHVIVAARSGIFASYNGGAQFKGIAFPPFYELDWHAVTFHPGDTKFILAELTCRRTLVWSDDGGLSWNEGSQAPDRMAWEDIVFAPSDPLIAYAGTAAWYSCGTFDPYLPAGGIYKSRNGGRSWEEVNDANTMDAAIGQIAVNPLNPQIVYAASFNKGLVKSTDGGDSWMILAGGLPGDYRAASVVLHPHEPQQVFTGGLRGGLYRSLDEGNSWEPVEAGLNPEANINDIVIDQTNPQRMYLADNFSGVYRSEDGGNTWIPMSHGMRNQAVNALALSSDGAHLYAAVEGDGTYRVDLKGSPPPAAQEPMPTETSSPAPTPTPRAEEPAGGDSAEGEQVGEPAPPPVQTGCPSSFLPLMFILGWSGYHIHRKIRF